MQLHNSQTTIAISFCMLQKLVNYKNYLKG